MEDVLSFTQEDADLFLESSYYLLYEDEQTYKAIGDSFDYAGQLVTIEKYLKRLSDNETYSIRSYDILITLRDNIADIEGNFPLSTFSPYIELYFETDRLCRADNSSSEEFLDELKKGLSTEDLKKKIRAKKKQSSKNKRSLLNYIDNLFECRSKLLVIRLDLGYHQDSSGFFTTLENDRIDLLGGIKSKKALEKWSLEVRQQRDELIKLLKKRYQKTFIGYAWKLEYGADKAFHFHTIFFLDGNKERQDILIAKGIGEIWKKDITKGKGVYWNANARKEDFRKSGRIATGMINHTDKELRENLEIMASYLTKPDYFVKTTLPNNARSLGKGEAPKKIKSGRPRE